jgi:hypothetical protein
MNSIKSISDSLFNKNTVNNLKKSAPNTLMFIFRMVLLISIGFVIIDFPAAIAVGLFIGVLNLVPYLQVVSLLPMALLAKLKAANTGGEFWPIMFMALVVISPISRQWKRYCVLRILISRRQICRLYVTI